MIAFMSISGKKENLIMLIISLELILLAIGILFVHVSFLLDDMIGATLTLYLLPLAGAESAIA
jgi:NADH:ubiquinone oxidoreductase subunit K